MRTYTWNALITRSVEPSVSLVWFSSAGSHMLVSLNNNLLEENTDKNVNKHELTKMDPHRTVIYQVDLISKVPEFSLLSFRPFRCRINQQNAC